MLLKSTYFVLLFLLSSSLSFSAHTWLIENHITDQRSLLVDLRETEPINSTDLAYTTWSGIDMNLDAWLLDWLAPVETFVLPLGKEEPKEDTCDCKGKRALAAFFQNPPLNEIEKQAIAEVEAHRPIDWNPDASEEEWIVTDLCSMMVEAQNYVGENIPAPLVNALQVANILYGKATGDSVPPVIPGIPYTAKQVYIGKVFFEEYLLRQKCKTSGLINHSENGQKYKEIDGKPLFYADVFNEKGDLSLVFKLDSVKYQNQSSTMTQINHLVENANKIDELIEFHSLLKEILKQREPTDKVYRLALNYCKEFGFKGCDL